MPALGMAQETGKLLAWFKQEGDTIAKGEPLMEIETDKVTVSIDATESGVLANIVASAGQDIPVGHAIALILAEGEQAPPREELLAALKAAAAPAASAPAAAPRPATAGRPAPAVRQQAAPAAGYAPVGAVVVNASPIALRIAAEHGVDLAQVRPSGGRISKDDVREYLRTRGAGPAGGFAPIVRGAGEKVLASPKAKRLAQEMGIDLALLRGSGPEGAVLAIDVLNGDVPVAAAQPAHEPAGPPLSSLWKVMAEHVTESWQDIPHFVLSREVDATNMMAARKAAQAAAGETKITFTDLLVKYCAAALAQHPNVNATWRSRTIWPNEHINIGLAVGVEDGLVAPVVADADKLSLQDVALRRAELVQKANSRSLLPADIQGGTFTISNLGMYAIDSFTAIVNAPNAAILAVGRIVERVVPVDGQPAIRPMLALTLSCDHRVLDGLRGAQFLDTLAGLIEAAELKE
ncbi:MAG: 2-oxo acid dehydrogenase subunit E2 [Anaerolineales bacterium]|nr:MAG: 2-oxo acid dehydrogenase subunit E2 [Anaerolineales bacterium]